MAFMLESLWQQTKQHKSGEVIRQAAHTHFHDCQSPGSKCIMQGQTHGHDDKIGLSVLIQDWNGFNMRSLRLGILNSHYI